jgi:hypothetical protein
VVEQNPFKQNQSKPRLAFMRPTHQLTIDQHYLNRTKIHFDLDRLARVLAEAAHIEVWIRDGALLPTASRLIQPGMAKIN